MPVPELAVVHPLVLLSVVDHYNRVARDTRKRVIGVLLGEASKGRVDITNSFAGANLEIGKLEYLCWSDWESRCKGLPCVELVATDAVMFVACA